MQIVILYQEMSVYYVFTILSIIIYSNSTELERYARGMCWEVSGLSATMFVMFTDLVTWPVARDMCITQNGKLVEMSNSIKYDIIQDFLLIDPWLSSLSGGDFSFWTGLYDISPPNRLFTWTNSCSIDEYSNSWFNSSGGSQCVLSMYQTPEWYTANCSEKHKFLCEIPTDISCIYEYESNRGIWTSFKDIESVKLEDLTTAECTETCRTNSSCWAAGDCNLFGEIWCNLYLTQDPRLVSKTTASISCGLYTKICLEAHVASFPASQYPDVTMPMECPYEVETSTVSPKMTSTRDITTTDLLTSTTDRTSTSTVSPITSTPIGDTIPTTESTTTDISSSTFDSSTPTETTVGIATTTTNVPDPTTEASEDLTFTTATGETTTTNAKISNNQDTTITAADVTTSPMTTLATASTPGSPEGITTAHQFSTAVTTTFQDDTVTTTNGIGYWSSTPNSPSTGSNHDFKSTTHASVTVKLGTTSYPPETTRITEKTPTEANSASSIKSTIDYTTMDKTISQSAMITTTAVTLSSVGNVSNPKPTALGPCDCNCDIWEGGKGNLTNEEKEVWMATLIEALVVNKSKLSSTRRRYISIQDDRKSARYVGYVGAGMLLLYMIIIILFDLDRFSLALKDIQYNTFKVHGSSTGGTT